MEMCTSSISNFITIEYLFTYKHNMLMHFVVIPDLILVSIPCRNRSELNGEFPARVLHKD
jgi:hypothetical protein